MKKAILLSAFLAGLLMLCVGLVASKTQDDLTGFSTDIELGQNTTLSLSGLEQGKCYSLFFSKPSDPVESWYVKRENGGGHKDLLCVDYYNSNLYSKDHNIDMICIGNDMKIRRARDAL